MKSVNPSEILQRSKDADRLNPLETTLESPFRKIHRGGGGVVDIKWNGPMVDIKWNGPIGCSEFSDKTHSTCNNHTVFRHKKLNHRIDYRDNTKV